jgi:hypothetical protein
VRILSASNLSVRNLVEKGKFRNDLFYRLYVYPIYVPALADRKEDIPLLANHFLAKFAAEQKKGATSFHARLLDFMRQRVPLAGHHSRTGKLCGALGDACCSGSTDGEPRDIAGGCSARIPDIENERHRTKRQSLA